MADAPLADFKPQGRNTNKHTARGMGMLEKSVQKDGWIGAITVAADGETFDGSARIEVASLTGFENAIVIESDGTRPVIHRRIDIPNADDMRAKRLGIAANRIAEINLDYNLEEMAGLLAECPTITDGLFLDDELAKLAAGANTPAPGERKVTCPSCGTKFAP